MRLPSDAQAAVLSCVDEHAHRDEQVYAGFDHDGGAFAALYVERTSDEVSEGAKPPAVLVGDGYHNAADVLLRFASVERPRVKTVEACVRHGWLDVSTTREFEAKCVGVSWRFDGASWEVCLAVADLTEDGVIALGAWRQRKLAAPQPDLPTLAGDDREVVALAERAARLGFILLPDTDDARRHARRLARTPFAERGWGGGTGTRSIRPTALGAVEVNPEAADTPVGERAA